MKGQSVDSMYESTMKEDDDFGREEEKARRRQKLDRRAHDSDGESFQNRKGRLPAFDKSIRRVNWKQLALAEEEWEDEQEGSGDDSDDGNWDDGDDTDRDEDSDDGIFED